MLVSINMMSYESTVPIKAFHRQEDHTIQHMTEQSPIFTIMHTQNMPVGSEELFSVGIKESSIFHFGIICSI